MPLKAFRGPKVWLWRWRRNPLKRRADVVEAWVLLGAWLVTVVTGVVAGLVASRSVEHGLARERVEWHPVVAQVAQKAPGSATSGSGVGQVWTKVRWTLTDGSSHTGQARVAPGSKAGTPITVWTDPRGHLVTRPVTAAQAHRRANLIGGLAGVSTAAVPFITGLAVRGRLERHRMDHWDAEWARFGPQWGRTTG
ncbi:Rv1733c family protein [Streptomyces olivochromogenes]|uniref:Rv1733c family protein n=1 Tax=Streptomyces olivochromogenes TaxID=1963 RepID=UPI001F244004|nr:hypothetical protein [Streptomyces olivochromogenes]MCF3136721.1 hypothetical protein [Streptomyces olivochromogenes]